MPPPTEQTLLSRYLLPPSSLPTILPYTTFISFLPSSLASTATNDRKSTMAILIKRLYRDLQFQRDIDIDTVALNIQRECQRSEVLRGRLRREVREELGYPTPSTTTLPLKSGSNGLKRKRTPDDEDNASTQSQLSTASDAEDEDEASTAPPSTIPPTYPKTITSKTPSPTTPYNPLLAPLETRLDNLFSGPRGLAPTLLPPSQRYHTTTSLLHSMRQSISHLTSEINSLNNQSAHILEGMRETVGGMSDLRYGKFARVSGRSSDTIGAGDDGEGGGGGGGLEEEVAEALRELKQVVDRKTQDKRKGKGKGLER